MSNGYSTEQMLDRLEEHLTRLEDKLDGVRTNGCAHRVDDIDRIKRLEDRTWADRGISGALGAAIGYLSSWIKG